MKYKPGYEQLFYLVAKKLFFITKNNKVPFIVTGNHVGYETDFEAFRLYFDNTL